MLTCSVFIGCSDTRSGPISTFELPSSLYDKPGVYRIGQSFDGELNKTLPFYIAPAKGCKE